jgi:hypothetical protein
MQVQEDALDIGPESSMLIFHTRVFGRAKWLQLGCLYGTDIELEKVRKMEKLNESIPHVNVGVMNEKVYEKYAWIILFAIGVLVLVGGVPTHLASTQTQRRWRELSA